MITSTQAQQYLDQALGVGVPSFIVDAAVTKIAALESAMSTAGYSAADMVLIQSMAVAIIAAAGAPRRVSQQGAPSGASRGFKYSDADLSALRKSLATLDTAGVTLDAIGPEPSTPTMLMVVG